MRRLLVISLLAALVASGCGGQSADNTLNQTAQNMGKIRSGELSMQLVVSTGDGKRVGFTLRGPFALAKPGALPVARVAYTQLAGPQTRTVTVISTGRKAFVQLAGKTYSLPASRVAGLRSSGGAGAAGGLQQLAIGNWFEDPKVSDGGQVGGTDTDRIHSRLNVVQAANGLLGLANTFGRQAGGPVQGHAAAELTRAVRAATIDVWTGKHDRLLRRLVIDASLAARVPARIRTALGTTGSVRFHLELGIDNPNQPVHVTAPAGAQPLPA
jgi:hypothetical protein